MENLHKIRKFYHLKNVERGCTVLSRKESAAEHSWSCLILADYFLTLMNDSKLDRLKVYELLMYHDVVEIEAGDVNINDLEKRKLKKAREQEALHSIKEKIPKELKRKFVDLFTEYEKQKTKEAKFAKAIDYFDAELHEVDYKKDWKGWTEDFLQERADRLHKEFPIIREAWKKMMDYVRKEGYFNQ